MFRIVMSIIFVVVLVGGYFLVNGLGETTQDQPTQQSQPASGMTFNGL